MAKRRRKTTGEDSRQTPLAGMEDEFQVTEAVQEAADEYRKRLASKNTATGKFNTAKESLIAAMRADGVEKVRVLAKGGGAEIIKLNSTDKLKIEKDKRGQGGDEDED